MGDYVSVAGQRIKVGTSSNLRYVTRAEMLALFEYAEEAKETTNSNAEPAQIEKYLNAGDAYFRFVAPLGSPAMTVGAIHQRTQDRDLQAPDCRAFKVTEWVNRSVKHEEIVPAPAYWDFAGQAVAMPCVPRFPCAPDDSLDGGALWVPFGERNDGSTVFQCVHCSALFTVNADLMTSVRRAWQVQFNDATNPQATWARFRPCAA